MDMTPEQFDAFAARVAATLEEMRVALYPADEPGDEEPEEPPVTEVPAGGHAALQEALTVGGRIRLAGLDAGYGLPDGYLALVENGTQVEGRGATLSAATGPALSVGMRTSTAPSAATFAELMIGTGYKHAAIRIGRNDSGQVDPALVPQNITFTRVYSLGHRGKRAFEINGAGVRLENCEVRDLYHPDAIENQGVCVLNSPGSIAIEGGHFEGASQCLMVGGDTMKIPGVRPTGIHIARGTYTRPLAWKATSFPDVKTIIELKDGLEVVIDSCLLSNCWKSDQDGFAFTFTPANGGAVSVDVLNCTVRTVANIVSITGKDAHGINTTRTKVRILGGSYHTDRDMGGQGRFALIQHGPELVEVIGCDIQHHGSSCFYIDAAPIDRLVIEGNRFAYGTYGMFIGGRAHGDNSAGTIRQLIIRGNTIAGAASGFKARYPDNTYV
jgi:hypothetical protein